jgi:hypothetical protein
VLIRKCLQIEFNSTLKKIHIQVKFMSESQRFLNTYKHINVNKHMNRTKSKNHMVKSIGANKILENIQYHFMITNAPVTHVYCIIIHNIYAMEIAKMYHY